MRVLTFDIGGANVKRLLYDSRSKDITSDIFYFPLWKRKDELTGFLRRKSIRADVVGVTMTAELSDVFADKASGIMHVVDACENSLGNPWYLTVDGRVIRKDEIQNPLPLAASNWVASRYLLEENYREGILVDVGSTTTDVVPFGPGIKPRETDLERLCRGQLVYTGFLRTPLSAVVKKVPYRGTLTRISSEYFAITADAYNVLGLLGKYSCSTPDGGGKSKRDSMRRIARHLCADLDDVGGGGITEICKHVYQEQSMDIAEALGEVMKDSGMRDAYVCGVGSVLGKRACEIARLTAHDLSALTPAHANLPCLGLAEILRERGKV